MISQDTLDFLEHYGIQGQRWGVRRKNPSSHPNVSKLSNQQLGKLVKRMELNKKYDDVVTAPKPRTEGKAYAHSLLKSAGTTVVTAAIGAAVGFAVQRALKAKVGVDVAPKTFAPPLPIRSLPPPFSP